MANVKIPYALIPAVAVEQRRAQVLSALARGLPRLQRQPTDDRRTLYVACYGPSLRQTWEELRGKSPIMAMSGATKWLAERGIIADYALEMDPRVSQLIVTLPPVPGVHYLMASCVCSEVFDRVLEAGNPVTLWHTVNTNWEDELRWVSQHDAGSMVVHAGSTVGISALHIGGILGFTRFEIHGMDGSFGEDGVRHAGTHGGKEQHPKLTWAAGGRTYRTSKIMANAVAEAVNTAKNFPIVTIWHGDGLTQALIREANLQNACCADETEKRSRLMGLSPKVVHMPPIRDGHRTFWEAVLDHLVPTDLPELAANISLCEPRRASAKYNTGTVPFQAAAYLRAICRFYEPAVIAEVGTFIGTSTLALRATRVVYTCDRSNDCVPALLSNDVPNILTHPYRGSTQMFAEIQEPVDLFFFDGRIQPEDLPHIKRLMRPTSVFIVDDYVGHEKGVVNVQALAPLLPGYLVIPPAKGPSTLAALVPVNTAERTQVA